MPTIAYQGVPGAFSERAAKAFFGKKSRTKPAQSFKNLFQSVSSAETRYGVIPIENSLFGSVHENYDLLLRHKLHIVGEVKLRIQLHVMALPSVSMRKVKVVYSHPQALGQCEQFLRRWKGVEVVAYYDTAGSAKMIQEQQRMDAAAIASAEAAQAYGLRILRRNVESNHHNYTRFLVLSKRRGLVSAPAKTSVVFAVRNTPGALFKALGSFALREVNLLKIESRPLVGKPWQYLFYLDIEGSAQDPHIIAALKHLQELSTLMRVLGSYPVGKTIRT